MFICLNFISAGVTKQRIAQTEPLVSMFLKYLVETAIVYHIRIFTREKACGMMKENLSITLIYFKIG